MRRNAKCQHVRGQPSNICMCATCASHAHPATICTCIAKTARTYWCPQPPTCFSRGRYHLKSKQEDLELSLLKLDWFGRWFLIEYLLFYPFAFICINRRDRWFLLLIWFDSRFKRIELSNIYDRLFTIKQIELKQMFWNGYTVYTIGWEESDFVNASRSK